MTPTGIAFFDLDRTLIGVNSMSLWFKRELREGRLSRRKALLGGLWMGAYHLGVGKMDDAIRAAVANMKGQDVEPFRKRSQDFWREEVVGTVQPRVAGVLAHHRAQGHKLVLLTSSSSFIAEVVLEDLGLDAFCANRFVTEGGCFTGALVEPLCFGAGKVVHAQAEASAHGLALADCWFYTDSITDLPGLEAVGHPVAINPDPRLARAARGRGWPVEDWGVAPEAP